jgi:hypothetical protein
VITSQRVRKKRGGEYEMLKLRRGRMMRNKGIWKAEGKEL